MKHLLSYILILPAFISWGQNGDTNILENKNNVFIDSIQIIETSLPIVDSLKEDAIWTYFYFYCNNIEKIALQGEKIWFATDNGIFSRSINDGHVINKIHNPELVIDRHKMLTRLGDDEAVDLVVKCNNVFFINMELWIIEGDTLYFPPLWGKRFSINPNDLSKSNFYDNCGIFTVNRGENQYMISIDINNPTKLYNEIPFVIYNEESKEYDVIKNEIFIDNKQQFWSFDSYSSTLTRYHKYKNITFFNKIIIKENRNKHSYLLKEKYTIDFNKERIQDIDSYKKNKIIVTTANGLYLINPLFASFSINKRKYYYVKENKTFYYDGIEEYRKYNFVKSLKHSGSGFKGSTVIDKNNNIYVSTTNGVNKYSNKKWSFTPTLYPIKNLLIDANKNIWGVTSYNEKGLCKFDGTCLFLYKFNEPSSVWDGYQFNPGMYTSWLDKSNNLWIKANNTAVLNKEGIWINSAVEKSKLINNQDYQLYKFLNKPPDFCDSSSLNIIHSFRQSINTNIIIYDISFIGNKAMLITNSGTYIYDSKQFKQLAFFKIDRDDYDIYRLFRQNKNYIANYDNLIYTCSPDTVNCEYLKPYNYRLNIIATDSSGNIYIRTSRNEPAIFNINTYHFQYIESFIKDNRDNIWFYKIEYGKDSVSVTFQNVIDNRTIKVSYNNHIKYRTNVPYDMRTGLPTLCFDLNNVIWIGTDGGLFRIENNEVNHFIHTDGLINNEILNILVDKKNNKWICSSMGIIKIEDKKH